MSRKLDLIGCRFGRLRVLASGDSQHGKGVWRCLCDCGNTISAYAQDLRCGKTGSCGCLHRDRITRHGDTHHGSLDPPEYQAWKAMKQRCTNPRHPAYVYYGGRGIAVCPQWLTSYARFLADMGRKPSPQHSIDRIDNDGGYSPENCRWATSHEQASNKRPRARRLLTSH